MKSSEQLYEFLNGYLIGVLSTINADGVPNAAIVGFGQTKDLELLFATDDRSRKYANLSANPHVAFTVGGETPETIQYQGTVRELNESEFDLVRNNYWNKNPYAEKLHNHPNGRYFIVTPTWIRYTDLRAKPWDITERTFDQD